MKTRTGTKREQEHGGNTEKTSVIIRRLVLWLLIIWTAFLLYNIVTAAPQAHKKTRRHKLAVALARLKLGAKAGPSEYIVINGPSELDYKTRHDILRLRKQFVMQHPELIEGRYSPSPTIFARIEDNKPWWGIEGQCCKGKGKESLDGFSEETRFINNPFLLLAVDDSYVFIYEDPCPVVYPFPFALLWKAQEKTATAFYDMTRYFKERPQEMPRHLDIININARDFGYNYLQADKERSFQISAPTRSRLFKEPVYIREFIHTGGSCGIPGGCNNVSPYEPNMKFRIDNLPAALFCKLFKRKPKNQSEPADFSFVLYFM